tara:strand:- start:1062 stop:1520 length:459 start_codon:yes stop_codon:yes gene_type:complete
MEGTKILAQGLTNWKLRLVLSAVLCIMGLAGMISMLLGLFVDLSVYDKSIVAIAIWMVGIPAYLIVSGLANITPHTITGFLNERLTEIDTDTSLLLENVEELDEESKSKQEYLINFFSETPLYQYLPDKPVKQAYMLMLISMVGSFMIWFLG